MLHLLAYRLSDGEKALAYNDGFIGDEKLDEAKKHIPNWNSYHVAGVTWSYTALLYWMSFRPCIIQLNDFLDIKEMLPEKAFVTTDRKIAGNATYIVLREDSQFNVVFDRKIIDEGITIAKPFYEQ